MKKSNIGTGLVIALTAGYASAQGSLTPPGAPAPTMKTLDQIEPRTPISSVPYTINQPGSYYATTNLIPDVTGDGITITTGYVTLDLMGFTLAGGSGSGIVGESGNEDIVIQNGLVTGWGVDGIHLSGSGAVLKNLHSTYNGTDGFHIGTNTLVSDCVSVGNGDDGFSGEDGGNCRLERCRSQGNSYGFYFSSDANQLKKCEALGCAFFGMLIGKNSVLEGNTITDNGTGLSLSGTGTYIADNMVKGNGNNYGLVSGNQLNILLCEIPETFNWPCSIKLAGTLICTNSASHGITVNANNVTIDMAGHTLIGPGASSGSGIYQDSAYSNLRVFNGKIVHWEGDGGISAQGTASVLSDLQVSTNKIGILIGSASTIGNCTACNNSSDGIVAYDSCVIHDCAVKYNGSDGIAASDSCIIHDCAAEYNGTNGIAAIWNSTICDCHAGFNGAAGIYARYGSNISGCGAQYNKDGIKVMNNNRITDCVCENNSYGGDGAGIHATGTGNQIDSNHVAATTRGIDVDTGGNFIVRNIVSGCATNYDIVGGNNTGIIQTTPQGAGAWDNFAY